MSDSPRQIQIPLLDVQLVYKSYYSVKNEVNSRCLRGEYDLDTVKTILNDLDVLKSAIDSLDKCQTVIVNHIQQKQ